MLKIGSNYLRPAACDRGFIYLADDGHGEQNFSKSQFSRGQWSFRTTIFLQHQMSLILKNFYLEIISETGYICEKKNKFFSMIIFEWVYLIRKIWDFFFQNDPFLTQHHKTISSSYFLGSYFIFWIEILNRQYGVGWIDNQNIKPPLYTECPNKGFWRLFAYFWAKFGFLEKKLKKPFKIHNYGTKGRPKLTWSQFSEMGLRIEFFYTPRHDIFP